MRTVFLLNLRATGRSIDRSTGSPLARYSLVLFFAVLPLVLGVVGGLSAGNGSEDSPDSFASWLISSWFLSGTVAFTICFPLVLSWRLNHHLVALYSRGAIPAGQWQLGLLLPVPMTATWIACSASVPLFVLLARSQQATILERSVTIVIVCASAASVAVLATGLGLAARWLVELMPLRLRKLTRSALVLIGGVAPLIGGLYGWTASVQLLSSGSRAAWLSDGLLPLAAACSVAAVIAVAVGLSLSVKCGIGFASESIGSWPVPIPAALVSARRRPAAFGFAWLRIPASATSLFVGVALAALGMASEAWMPLAYAGLFIGAVSFVGYAPGNRAYVTPLEHSPVCIQRWYSVNGLGAIALWISISAFWAGAAHLRGEQEVLPFVALCTVVACSSLILGCTFSASYQSALGPEVAQLVAYVLAAILVLVMGNLPYLQNPGWSTSVVVMALSIGIAIWAYGQSSGRVRHL